MLLQKHITFLEKLYQKTISKGIKWKTSVERNQFQVSFPNYSVVISKTEDFDVNFNKSQDTIHFSIINSDGDLIETFDSDDVVFFLAEKNCDTRKMHRKLEDMYEMARRQALGADKALDEILEYL